MAEQIGSYFDLMQQPFEWPKEGDRLFVEEELWWKKADIASDVLSRFVAMWTGYRRAADVLVEYVESDNVSYIDRNKLIYPIVFCYRHSVELALKWLLLMYGKHANVEPNFKGHSLKTLWQSCRAVTDAIRVEPDSEERASADAVGAFIDELDVNDPASFAFRYATDTEGRVILLKVQNISLKNLAKKIEALHNYIKGLDGQLDHLTSASS